MGIVPGYGGEGLPSLFLRIKQHSRDLEKGEGKSLKGGEDLHK